MKFQDVKFKHEIFVRIDMKHSYFIICLKSRFSVVEIIIEQFVVCLNLIMLCIIVVLIVKKKEILK